LRGLEIDRTVLLTGYRAEEVEAEFGPATEERIFVPEPSPLGTGGALANARKWAGEINWIANGDSFSDLPAIDLFNAHRPGCGTILAVWMSDRADYGGLEIGEGERIDRFVEKGIHEPGWINAGVYILDRALLEDLPSGVSSLERDHFPRWAAAGKLVAYRTDAFFRDIGTPDRLAAAQREFGAIRARLQATGGEAPR
jgi:NDP-sugar pyrophosphorylase family protein